MFSFCRPVSSKKRFLPHRVLSKEYSFTLFDKASRVPADEWNTVAGAGEFFLHHRYLDIIERSEHTRMACRYVIVYRRNKPCGIIYFQIVDFQAGIFGDLMSKQMTTLRSHRLTLFEKYIGRNKEEVLMRLFTCGNNLVSGEYGFRFMDNVSLTKRHEILLQLIDVIAKEEKLRGTISAVLLKDFHAPLKPESLFEEDKYTTFHVEPNLVAEIPGEVESLTDYVLRFSKKYRNRAKSIFKKLDGVSTRYLKTADIVQLEDRMYALYENVFMKARFRLIKLPRKYFSEVKTAYPDHFVVKGFFRDDTMIAFSTAFIMPGDLLEAHYIGIDYDFNQEHELYQNILYTMIEEAIRNKRKKVNLGRTAAEIKTTVGAAAVDLICYIKPQNAISRIIQKPFISFLQPPEWIPRNPFKEEPLAAAGK
jgi:predicted N-acyltransferase